MKKVALFTLVYCCVSAHLFATDLLAYFNYATFSIPGKDPYVETYISVFGNSVQYKKTNGDKFRAEVEISLLFLQNDTIKASQKYVLSSPEVTDTSAKGTVNFIDLKRTPLKPGIYKMEMQIADKNKVKKPFLITQEIVISFPNDRVNFSDIELVESFSKSSAQGPLTKNGMDIVPYCSNFYPDNLEKLDFYAEIYNTKKILGDSAKFVVNYYIESYENKKRISKFNKFSTQKASAVNILLSGFNIAELPSGNYNLVTEVHDKTNALVAEQRVFFQRYNPKAKFDTDELDNVTVAGTFVANINNADTLREYIRSLRPISTESEKVFAENNLGSTPLTLMQQYFLTFWTDRDNVNPEVAWQKYHLEVLKVNKAFSSTGFKGYTTDRGRVYLQYGPPDQRTVVDNEPNTYPYEIWQYYRLKVQNQTNKKFVFVNEDLASNNYVLIHSDARGEINDSRWMMRLHKRTIQSNDMDMLKPGLDNYGNNVDDNFQNPK